MSSGVKGRLGDVAGLRGFRGKGFGFRIEGFWVSGDDAGCSIQGL